MSDQSPSPAARGVAAATLAGALLTWLAGAFTVALGLALLIAISTGGTALAGAIADVAALGRGADSAVHPAAWVVLVLVGVAPSMVAVAAFRGSRAGLVALSVLAGLYLLLVVVALGFDYASPVMLFGLLWVGAAIALFWLGQRRGCSPAGRKHRRRPPQVAAGAGLIALAGAAGVVLGSQMFGSGLSATLHPEPAQVFAPLGLHFGAIVAAIGAIVLVLTITALRGSRDMLIALTVVCALVTLTLVAALPGSDGPAWALVLLLAAWFGAGLGLLWCRAGRAWYRCQPT